MFPSFNILEEFHSKNMAKKNSKLGTNTVDKRERAITESMRNTTMVTSKSNPTERKTMMQSMMMRWKRISIMPTMAVATRQKGDKVKTSDTKK